MSRGRTPPTTVTRLVRELAEAGVPVWVACQVLGVPRSRLPDRATRPAPARRIADEALLPLIAKAHADSRGTYGAPRVHAELHLGMGVRIGRNRVAWLMREQCLPGLSQAHIVAAAGRSHARGRGDAPVHRRRPRTGCGPPPSPDMARWRRTPEGTIVHSDRGPTYTSSVFGHRLRQTGPLGSTGRVA